MEPLRMGWMEYIRLVLCALNWFYGLFALCVDAWIESFHPEHTATELLCFQSISIYGLAYSISIPMPTVGRTNKLHRVLSERRVNPIGNCLLVWPSYCASHPIYATQIFIFPYELALHSLWRRALRAQSVFTRRVRVMAFRIIETFPHQKGSVIVFNAMVHIFAAFALDLSTRGRTMALLMIDICLCCNPLPIRVVMFTKMGK